MTDIFASPWFIIITALLLGGQLIETWVVFLNLRRMGGELPPEFRDIFNGRDYARAQEYTRAQTQFELLRGWFWVLIVMGSISLNLFNHLDMAIRGLHMPQTATGLIFFAVLLLGADLLGLPFDLYHTFRLEEKFGMNRTTAKTFWIDKLKGNLLSLILGAALAWPLLFLLREAGNLAWIYCTLAFGLFMLVMQYIGPVLILPAFNKFKPVENPELRKDIFQLAEAAGFPLQEIYIMDGSKRSTKGNAFFAGIGKSKRIALFDTLLNRLTHSEILGVLAHEMGHFRLKHMRKGFIAILIKAALLFGLLTIFIHYPFITKSLGMENHSVHAAIVFFALLYSPLAVLLGIYGKWRSRKNEYEADEFAARLHSSHSLINSLKKLSKFNLGNLTPHPAFVFLHFSHPPVLDRIRKLQETI